MEIVYMNFLSPAIVITEDNAQHIVYVDYSLGKVFGVDEPLAGQVLELVQRKNKKVIEVSQGKEIPVLKEQTSAREV